MHGNLWHVQHFGNHCLALRRDPAQFLLGNRQAGHHRGLLLVGRVLGHFTRKARFGRFSNHRSISPNTISIVPMIATTSDSMWPLTTSSIIAKWAKPGARIFRR